MNEHRRFRLEGMACSACAVRVEKILSRAAGVSEGTVNFAMGTLDLTFDNSEISLDAIRQKLSKAGFRLGEERPDASALSARADEEASVLSRRLVWSAAFTVPLAILAMGESMGLPLPGPLSPTLHPTLNGALQALAAALVMAAHRDTYRGGLMKLFRRSPDMTTLVALGTLASFIFSLVSLLNRALSPAAPDSAPLALYFDSAAFILTLVTCGKYLEAGRRKKMTAALTGLAALLPADASVEKDGTEVRVPIAGLAVGDVIVVRPGERVATDGAALPGLALVDESAMTGEGMPVEKGEGDPVRGGTLVVDGLLRFRAEKVGGDTAMASVIRMVEDAQAGKAPVARLADRVAGVFVPAVMSIAAASAAIWLAAGHGVAEALNAMVSVLVIACPCALGLATPTAILVGTGRGAREGILFRSGEALETASKIDTVVFDKTGTLTTGQPRLTDLIPEKGMSEEQLLALAAGAECGSSHPLGRAILDAARERNIAPECFGSFSTVRGSGTVASSTAPEVQSASDGAVRVAVGNRRLMLAEGVAEAALAPWSEAAMKLSDEGKTPVYVASGGRPVGVCALADTPASGSAEAVAKLKSHGIRTLLLTGDNARTAAAVADALGIEDVVSDVLPDGKAAEIERLRREGRRVAMVGDGINDAPALAAADVGIALADGMDIAVEAADVVLVRHDILGVPAAIALSRAALRTIRQNLFFAFVYNALAIPAAAGVLTVWGGPAMSPTLAALCMTLSSLSVVTNALLLARRKAFL